MTNEEHGCLPAPPKLQMMRVTIADTQVVLQEEGQLNKRLGVAKFRLPQCTESELVAQIRTEPSRLTSLLLRALEHPPGHKD